MDRAIGPSSVLVSQADLENPAVSGGAISSVLTWSTVHLLVKRTTSSSEHMQSMATSGQRSPGSSLAALITRLKTTGTPLSADEASQTPALPLPLPLRNDHSQMDPASQPSRIIFLHPRSNAPVTPTTAVATDLRRL